MADRLASREYFLLILFLSVHPDAYMRCCRAITLAASLFFFPYLMFEAFNLSRQMSLLPARFEAIFIMRGAARRKEQEIHLLSRGHLLILLRIPQQLDLAVTRASVIDKFIGFVHQMLEDAVGILLAESCANRLDEAALKGGRLMSSLVF